jgi:transposase
VVRYTPIREITDKEKNKLHSLLDTNPEIKYRIKIVLLASEGYTVSEIREMTNTYDKTIRKWIHKFNEIGIEGLFTKIDYSPMVKIDNDSRKQIVKIASSNPRSGIKILYMVTEITCWLSYKRQKDSKTGNQSYTN